jgi:16S rRNA G966 N2-methylase RsmD
LNSNIFLPAVQKFLSESLKEDVRKLALSKSPFPEVSSRELAEQLDSKQRSEKKLPLWFNTPGIIFPPKLSIEQSSSELTAEYKSKLIAGDKLIDLTGGFGVDAYYFSQKARQVIHCERDEKLSLIAQHNAKVLGVDNISFINAESLNYLQTTSDRFSTIYIDPSRRIQTKKVFLLQDTEPDVVTNLPLLLAKASRIIIKTSPLFDIQSGLKELTNVSEVHVVSVKNDCKELLWVIDKDFLGEASITCTALTKEKESTFSFRLAAEKSLHINSYSAPQSFLYEPDVALLKAGCFKSIADYYQVDKLHPSTHLYTSDFFNHEFIGKVFSVKSVIDYKSFIKENPIKKANVLSRNFPLSPDEIKKKHKIADGGDDYLIFARVSPDSLMVIHGHLNLFRTK